MTNRAEVICLNIAPLKRSEDPPPPICKVDLIAQYGVNPCVRVGATRFGPTHLLPVKIGVVVRSARCRDTHANELSSVGVVTQIALGCFLVSPADPDAMYSRRRNAPSARRIEVGRDAETVFIVSDLVHGVPQP